MALTWTYAVNGKKNGIAFWGSSVWTADHRSLTPVSNTGPLADGLSGVWGSSPGSVVVVEAVVDVVVVGGTVVAPCTAAGLVVLQGARAAGAGRVTALATRAGRAGSPPRPAASADNRRRRP